MAWSGDGGCRGIWGGGARGAHAEPVCPLPAKKLIWGPRPTGGQTRQTCISMEKDTANRSRGGGARLVAPMRFYPEIEAADGDSPSSTSGSVARNERLSKFAPIGARPSLLTIMTVLSPVQDPASSSFPSSKGHAAPRNPALFGATSRRSGLVDAKELSNQGQPMQHCSSAQVVEW